ncbi:hypothetical protein ACIBSV_06350 [Embleya sp. NPDC050154]|uniref:hypothetical protein n=1 Tax=unclassified Embleya TaxID=2699296 RepID=UPI0037BABC91|nr:hypothetical protein OG948_26770 [Embleya sp. NBC_00888]
MEDLDAVEQAMLANLLDGRRPRRRTSETPTRSNRQHQPPQQQRRQAQSVPRAVIPAPVPAAAPNRDATRVLDIGRVIKQIDPRTTPEQRHAMATSWTQLDLTAAQVLAWLTAGILPAEYKLAAACLERGLTPQDMKTRLDGVRVVERLRSDGVDGVVAQLRSGAA